MTKTKKKTKKVVLKSLTEKERVEVLKDAVKQLNANRYVARSGTYVGSEFTDRANLFSKASKGFGKDKNKVDLKSFVPIILEDIDRKGESCDVCAKGALAISAIAKLNSCPLGKGEKLDDLASSRIQVLFGKDNADLMERYFEGVDDDSDTYPDWISYYPESEERLLAIFRNAINNKGVFTPQNEKFE